LDTGFVVSSTAKNPEAAIKFLDYMATEEGDTLMYLGVEGLMYEWTDKTNGKYQRLGAYTDDAMHRAAGGFTFWPGIPEANIEVRLLNKLTQEAQAFGRANQIDWPYIIAPLNAQSEHGGTLADIEWQALAQLITTTGNVRNEYNSFVARWENEGGKQWEIEATAAYKAQQR
jgi:putative aldouronate transport system substrate-binding protein